MVLKLSVTRYLKTIGLSAVLATFSLFSHADTAASAWTLVGEQSKVAFVSIKKDTVGESNHFTSLSGDISTEGNASIAVDLTSVETHIGIRNDRLIQYIFGGDAATATLKATLDIKTLNRLVVGETKTLAINGSLHFLDKVIDITTTVVAARLNEKRLFVVTDEMIILKTEALGVNDGVDKLVELAGLPSITRVVPVTLRMVFDKK